MRGWSAVVFLVQWIAVGSEQDHLLSYGQHQETLLTLEGEDRSAPRVYRQKFKRFLSFNNDASNIRVEMVFAVPFLQIPIGGKTVEGPYGNGVTPMVDINAKSLLTATVLLFMLFFVVPKLVRVFVPTFPEGRGAGMEESEVSRVMRGVESALHVNTTACWQHGLCSLALAGRHDPPSQWGKILDGISSIKWIEKATAGTSFGEAMALAKADGGCDAFYAQCPLNSETLGHFAKELARRYMNHLIQLTNRKQGNP